MSIRMQCRIDQPEPANERTMEPEMPYTETDPDLVRELAEAAFRNDVNVGSDRDERVEATIIASGVAGTVLGEKFDAWSKAVGAEYERLAAVSTPHRYTLAEFPALIRREGGLVDLFMNTGIDPDRAPVELEELVGDANELEMRLRAAWDRIAEICGYDEDEES